MIVQQPGGTEDLRGEPFVGRAGQLLNEALETLDVERDEIYLTNIVKHFKWERALEEKRGAASKTGGTASSRIQNYQLRSLSRAFIDRPHAASEIVGRVGGFVGMSFALHDR
ncbi:MAG: uracil-DNA glycosylase family protein, partial [Verrucomicrobiota bacterium]